MKKPSNYNDIQVGNYEVLEPGGHRCVVKQVEETKSKNGNDMLIISFDTANEDTQPQYFTKKWMNDTRAEKKWGGVHRIVTEGEYGQKNLKGFCTALEHSNEGFSAWDSKDELNISAMKNLNIGIVFRTEEYLKQDSEIGRTTKPFYVCDYNKAETQNIPKVKELASEPEKPTAANAPWLNVAEDDENGLPFN